MKPNPMKAFSLLMTALVILATVNTSYSQDWEGKEDENTGEKYYTASSKDTKQSVKTFSYNLEAFVSQEKKSLGFNTIFTSKIDPVREDQEIVVIEFKMMDKSTITVNGSAEKFEIKTSKDGTFWKQRYNVPVDKSLDMRILSGTIIGMNINNVLSSKTREKDSREIQDWILAIARKNID